MKTKIRVLTAISFSLILSCHPVPGKNQVNDHSSFTQAVKFKRIEYGQGGIISGYEFYSDPPESLKTAFNATGSLAIYDKSGRLVSAGVGIHIKNIADNQEYILTAAHIIYHHKTYQIRDNTYQIRGNRMFFGYINDAQDDIILNINFLPPKKEFRTLDDWVMIPIEPVENRVPFETNLKENKTLRRDNKGNYIGYFAATSSISSNDASTAVRFVQKSDKVFLSRLFETSQISRALTSLDAIKGMSGSPVFYVDHKEVTLIGLIVRRAKVKNCEKLVYFCLNNISVIDYSRFDMCQTNYESINEGIYCLPR